MGTFSTTGWLLNQLAIYLDMTTHSLFRVGMRPCDLVGELEEQPVKSKQMCEAWIDSESLRLGGVC
jgi:hypothetical protein